MSVDKHSAFVEFAELLFSTEELLRTGMLFSSKVQLVVVDPLKWSTFLSHFLLARFALFSRVRDSGVVLTSLSELDRMTSSEVLAEDDPKRRFRLRFLAGEDVGTETSVEAVSEVLVGRAPEALEKEAALPSSLRSLSVDSLNRLTPNRTHFSRGYF